MKGSLVVLFAIVATGVSASSGSALAAEGINCDFFDYQEEAQFGFDRDETGLMDSLDPDGNGVACEDLPSKPDIIAESISFRASFDRFADSPGSLDGAGYSSHFTLELAGLDWSDDCQEFTDADFLGGIVAGEGKVGFNLHAVGLDGGNPGIADDGDRHEFTGLAYVVADNPATPVQLNTWMVEQGIAAADTNGLPENIAEQLENAEAQAKAAEAGIWGNCDGPETALKQSVAGGEESASGELRFTGSGEQIEPFAITEPGMYTITIEVSGNVAFVDVYTADGDWLPGMGISASEAGEYESAGRLEAGDYYLDIKAIGNWVIVITPGVR